MQRVDRLREQAEHLVQAAEQEWAKATERREE
jgi:hypothetical protein